MGAHVHNQVAGLGECLTARLADIRLLPRMRPPHVRSQGAGFRERLATRLAVMRLLPRMGPQVLCHVIGPRERLVTTIICTHMTFGGRWHVWCFRS